MAQRNGGVILMKILYKIKSGSHLYGLTTPASDIDYVGVYLEDTLAEHLDIFNTKDEMDLSTVSKLENGKNSTNAIDEKYYSLKKFLKLCSDCNPNLVEMLFAPEECIEFVDPMFKYWVLDRPEMFINTKLVDRFIGYAKSQEQKSYTKSDNYVTLNTFLNSLKRVANLITKQAKMRDAVLHIDPELFTGKANSNPVDIVYEVGDMKFPSGVTVKEAIARIEERFARASHRIDGIFINKYEPKFLSHTVRLLDEGAQLLKNKKIEFPFTGEVKKDIMDIKLGITPVSDVPDIINKYKDALSYLEVYVNDIPLYADRDAINVSYLKIITDRWRELTENVE